MLVIKKNYKLKEEYVKEEMKSVLNYNKERNKDIGKL